MAWPRHALAEISSRAPLVLAGLTLGGCAVAPSLSSSPGPTLMPVGPALDVLARRLIERVERESNCRYLLAGRTAQAQGSPFIVVLLSYRGPEVECRQSLERLNHHGASHGITFIADRLRLARARV